MIACNGWLDVLLYASTRADIVFCDLPPGEGTGLDTFNFMGRRMSAAPTSQLTHSRARSNVSTRTDSRMALERRSVDTQSLAHLYGVGEIRVKGEVTVSLNSLEDGSAGRSPIGNATTYTPSAHTSRTWESRSAKSVRSLDHVV